MNCLPISHEVDSALDDCAVPVAGDFPEVQSYRDVSGAHAACSALCPRVSEGRLRAPFLSKLKNSVIIHSEAKARQILNQFECLMGNPSLLLEYHIILFFLILFIKI